MQMQIQNRKACKTKHLENGVARSFMVDNTVAAAASSMALLMISPC